MEQNSNVFKIVGAAALAVILAGGRAATTGADSDAIGRAGAERITAPVCRGDVADSSSKAKDLPTCPDAHELLQKYFGVSVPLTDSGATSIDVVIAIIPDPIASHLDWAYDSNLEAIRRAMERSGYVADRFWLPWSSQGDTSRSRVQRLLSLAEQRPGVMLFRRANPAEKELRVVYIVGETPTGGVHKEALRRAIDERDTLLLAPERSLGELQQPRRAADSLKIVGPVFSGSVVSMQRALWSWAARGTAVPRVVRVFSGGATDNRNRGALICGTAEKADSNRACGPLGKVEFKATVNSNARLQDVFNRRIRERLGIAPSQVAYLREATTQYGQQSANDTVRGPSQPLDIPFPMNISSLRSQYSRNTDNMAGLGAPPTGRTAHTHFDLRDPATATETPPMMSDITPAGLELLLDQMARDITVHRIRMVGILATDVRDKLFLAVEMKKRIRDIQIFTFGSNILYLRPDFNEQLLGMYILSTYPLFPENQWWGRTFPSGERLSFASDIAEGTFNAMLLQLDKDALLEEYGDPIVDGINRTPPVWVTTVGRTSFAPILRDVTDVPPDSLGGYVYARRPIVTQPSTERGWSNNAFAFMLALFVAGFVLCFIYLQVDTAAQVRQDRVAGIEERRSMLEFTAPFDNTGRLKQREALQRIVYRMTLLLHREFYVLLRLIGLGGAFIPLIIIALKVKAHGQPIPPWNVWLVLLAVLAVLFTASVVIFALLQISHILQTDFRHGVEYATRWRLAGRQERRQAVLWWIELVARALVLLFGVLYAAATIAFVFQVNGLGAEKIFFNRAVLGFSGVSPAVPLVLGGIVFALWSTWHLTRITILSETTAFEEACMSGSIFKLEKPNPLRHPGKASAREPFVLFRWNEYVILGKVDSWAAAEARGAAAVKAREAKARTEEVGKAHDEALAQEAVRTAANAPQTPNAPDPMSVDAPSRVRRLVQLFAHKAIAIATYATAAGRAVRFFARKAIVTSTRTAAAAKVAFMGGLNATLPVLAGEFSAWGGRDAERVSAADSVRDVRRKLTLLIPGRKGVALTIAILISVGWLWGKVGRTTEATVFPPWLGGLSAFDWLFRFAIFGSTATTVWGVYRLAAVWSALRATLSAVVNPRLLDAFARLPKHVPELTRLSPFGIPSHSAVDEIVRQQWNVLSTIYEKDKDKYVAGQAEEIRCVMAMNTPPPISWDHHESSTLGVGFTTLMERLERLWRMIPDTDTAPPLQEGKGMPDQCATHCCAVDEPALRWMRVAETFAAVYIVEYIEWVLRNLRYLAMFLLAALVITTLLLSSYPFMAQNLLRLVYFFIFIITVGSLVTMILQMERNAVLSHIAGTEPGGTSWTKGSLLANLALYGATPVLTMIGWEFPPVRDFLLSWIAPAMKMITQ